MAAKAAALSDATQSGQQLDVQAGPASAGRNPDGEVAVIKSASPRTAKLKTITLMIMTLSFLISAACVSGATDLVEPCLKTPRILWSGNGDGLQESVHGSLLIAISQVNFRQCV